jgi:hypothetical protein
MICGWLFGSSCIEGERAEFFARSCSSSTWTGVQGSPSIRVIAKMLKNGVEADCLAGFMPRKGLYLLLTAEGAAQMKLRTVCAVATIFMAFFTIAVWKSPLREN